MTRRDRLVIVGVVIVAAIAASWFMLISPKRDQALKLGAKVTAAQQQLDSARSELAREFNNAGMLVDTPFAPPARLTTSLHRSSSYRARSTAATSSSSAAPTARRR